MMEWLRRQKRLMQKYYYERYYFLAKVFPPEVPRRPLSFLHDGFAVNSVANSGVRVIDNFCSVAGSSYLISRACEVGGDGALSAVVFNATHQDPVLMPLLYRISMLTGIPLNHAGSIEVGLVPDTLKDCPVGKQQPRNSAKPCYGLHVFLTDEGELQFPGLDIGIEAAKGRAVLWPIEASVGVEPAQPVAAYSSMGSDNFWVASITLYSAKMFEPDTITELVPQTQKGVALGASDVLPAGTGYLQDPINENEVVR
ncbi:MAG: hypothetical protein HOH24_09960 [Chromatiales bacterium]|nr:hypothetical protein [Chromatiales bacterium]